MVGYGRGYVVVQSKNKLQWRFSQAERNAHRPNHVHIPTISKLERGGARELHVFFGLQIQCEGDTFNRADRATCSCVCT